MAEKQPKSENEKYEAILTEMKLQSNLIKHLIAEINQLKQILILSKSSVVNPSSNPQPTYDLSNNLLSIDSPMQKPPKLTNEEDLSYPSTKISFPLEEVLTNLTESDKEMIVDIWKNCQSEFKIIIESKKDNKNELFINSTFNVFIYIFDIMFIILKPEKDKFVTTEQSLVEMAKNLGPLPILLDFDLVDFINEQKKNENYSIGKKTASNLFEKTEKTFNSLGELLNVIL